MAAITDFLIIYLTVQIIHSIYIESFDTRKVIILT